MVHAMRGKEHVEWDNPYDVGMTGLIGFSSGYYAMLDCDVLLMLGTDFPYRQFYPKGSGVRVAQIDLRPEHLGRRAAIDLGLVGDVQATLQAILPRLETEARWFASCPSSATLRRGAPATRRSRKGYAGQRPRSPGTDRRGA